MAELYDTTCQDLLDLLLSGLSPPSCASASLLVRAEVSLEDASLESERFNACGDFSSLLCCPEAGAGSGEQLSTARELRWLGSLLFEMEDIGGARDAESDCDRKWAVDSL